MRAHVYACIPDLIPHYEEYEQRFYIPDAYKRSGIIFLAGV